MQSITHPALRNQVLSLYRQLFRSGSSFSHYNVREYVKRRTREEFKDHKNVTDIEQIQKLLQKAQTNLGIVQRQATISQMYANQKSVIE